MKTYRSTSPGLRVLLLALLALGISQSASAQFCWTAAGATGVLDAEDTPYALFLGPRMHVSDSAPFPVSVVARHSVTGIRQTSSAVRSYKWVRLRFRDNGTQAKVVAHLKQVNLLSSTGATDLLIFDSDTVTPSNDYQSVDFSSSCGYDQGYDFLNYLYFFRLELTRSSSAGLPSVHSVQVCDFPC